MLRSSFLLPFVWSGKFCLGHVGELCDSDGVGDGGLGGGGGSWLEGVRKRRLVG